MTMLIAACRAAIGSEPLAPPRLRDGDWVSFLRLSERHRVEGLAAMGIKGLALNPPSAIQAQIDAGARETAAAGLRAASASRRLSEAFSSAGIDHLFVKGLTLGTLAYGQPFLKSAIDVDLLVDPSAIGSAAATLERLDYRLAEPLGAGRDDLIAWHRERKESVWTSGDAGPPIDLHSRLADQSLLIPAIGMASPRQAVAVGGGLSLETLATPELIAYLSIHGASSAWFRLKWLTDITALLIRQGPGTTDNLRLQAARLGTGRAFEWALLLGHRLLGLPLAPELVAELQKSRKLRWLEAIAMRQLRGNEPTERRLGTLPIHLSQFFLSPGIGFKRAELIRQWRSMKVNRRYRAPS